MASDLSYNLKRELEHFNEIGDTAALQVDDQQISADKYNKLIRIIKDLGYHSEFILVYMQK